MSIPIGQLACWRKGPGGVWLIWGRHDRLVEALECEGVEVRRRDHTVEVVPIERVAAPNREGWAYAHPVGTTVGRRTVTQLETVQPGRRRTVARPTRGRRAKSEIARRSAKARRRR